MRIEAKTPEEYIAQLPEDRAQAIGKLRAVINKSLPKDFEETMSYGMIGWVVPHSVYPAGYHCDPKLPLPFMSIASQKNFVALYHMGMYADPQILEWFQEQYKEQVPTKLDMGKSCVRMKKIEHIPYDLIGELAGKIKAQEWIDRYESEIKR